MRLLLYAVFTPHSTDCSTHVAAGRLVELNRGAPGTKSEGMNERDERILCREATLAPGVLLAILIAMAASMFGAFEMAMPSRFARRLDAAAETLAKAAPRTRAFLQGAVFGLVACPCTGPFALSILAYVAQSRGPGGSDAMMALGFAALCVFGLGLGTLLLLAAVSAVGRRTRRGADARRERRRTRVLRHESRVENALNAACLVRAWCDAFGRVSLAASNETTCRVKAALKAYTGAVPLR